MNATNELKSNDTESEESRCDNPDVCNSNSEDSMIPSNNTWLPCGTGELTSMLPSIRGNNDEKSGEEIDLDDKDLDEPISSLDYENSSKIIDHLTNIKKDKIIILTTHDNKFDHLFDEIINI